MEAQTISIRPFIGAKNFEVSRSFYRDLGFQEVALGTDMSLFKTGELAFYLQDAYVKEWIENTMIFMEVKNTQAYYEWVVSLNLAGRITVEICELKLYRSDIGLSPHCLPLWFIKALEISWRRKKSKHFAPQANRNGDDGYKKTTSPKPLSGLSIIKRIQTNQ